MDREASNCQCYASFLYYHDQKPSLTYVTPATMSSALYRIYPLLLIADAILSNVMWICDDLCLPFIHLVMVLMVINIFCQDGQVDLSYISQLWIGLMSASFLIFSVIFYVLTVYEDFHYDSEPPTVDDIVIVLESIVDKLESMRREICNVDKKRMLQLAVLFTPLQYILIKVLSIKSYCMSLTVLCFLYHSNWFQCTLKLFWRILLIRKIYYSGDCLLAYLRKPLDFSTVLEKKKNCTYRIVSPATVKDLKGRKLQLQLQRLLPWDVPLENHENTNEENDFDLTIFDLKIHENQRKWQADDWSASLLPYERSRYSVELDGKMKKCHSPWQFQQSLLQDWAWLDDCWRPTEWIYSGTNWDFKGLHDSLECCTRTRTWNRRVFKLSSYRNI